MVRYDLVVHFAKEGPPIWQNKDIVSMLADLSGGKVVYEAMTGKYIRIAFASSQSRRNFAENLRDSGPEFEIVRLEPLDYNFGYNKSVSGRGPGLKVTKGAL